MVLINRFQKSAQALWFKVRPKKLLDDELEMIAYVQLRFLIIKS